MYFKYHSRYQRGTILRCNKRNNTVMLGIHERVCSYCIQSTTSSSSFFFLFSFFFFFFASSLFPGALNVHLEYLPVSELNFVPQAVYFFLCTHTLIIFLPKEKKKKEKAPGTPFFPLPFLSFPPFPRPSSHPVSRFLGQTIPVVIRLSLCPGLFRSFLPCSPLRIRTGIDYTLPFFFFFFFLITSAIVGI